MVRTTCELVPTSGKLWPFLGYSRPVCLYVDVNTNIKEKEIKVLRSDGRHGYEWAKIGDFINLTFYLTLELAKNSVLKLKFILFYFNLMILGVFCGI